MVLESKNEGPDDHFINALFTCKQECDTILTYKHYLEMKRFVEGLTANPLWAKFCPRNYPKYKYADRHGCTEDAYLNFT